jgi:hypothetical protein
MTMMKQINLNARYLIEIGLFDRQAGVKSGCCNTECSPRDFISIFMGYFTTLFVATLYRKS